MAQASIFPLRKRRLSIGAFIPPVSPIAMASALVFLAQEISRCLKPRVCQRRNATVIMRRIKVLSVLFEVVRDSGQPMPPSAMLCFHELYITLQRTKVLLQECNDGSKVWLLMQAESMAYQFHEFTQEIVTALDVFPLKLMDITEDVREQLELLHRQAKRSKVSVDPLEDELRKDVISVLDEFERKVTPDSAKLQKIFEHLEIKNGKDCRNEVQLLEEEIGNQCNNPTGMDGPVSLINSLISLIRYCKCVLFGVTEVESEVEKIKTPGSNSNPGNGEEGCSIPDDFRCPISLDLMRDPVLVSTGQTYDRFSITRWIDEGHSTCPKSGQALLHNNLIPNYALRNLIQHWCESHGVPFDKPEKSTRNASLESVATTRAALEATKLTAAFLVEKLCSGTAEVKKQVAYELRLLAKCGMDNRACIAEAGAIPLLIPLLSSDDERTQENAVTALLNLSIFPNNKKVIFDSPDSIDSIINVLKAGRSIEAKENAAATIFSLSAINDNKKIIGEKPDAIPALVDLLRTGTPRGKRDAVSALFNLSIFKDNALRVVEAGAVPFLVKLLGDDEQERPGLSDDALAALAVLGGQRHGLIAISQASAIPILVGLLRSASPKGKENSIAVLLALCKNGGGLVINSVLRIPSLVPSLYTLLTSGTPRAKRKATSFFKMLQRWEHSRLPIDDSFATYSTHSRIAITATAPLR